MTNNIDLSQLSDEAIEDLAREEKRRYKREWNKKNREKQRRYQIEWYARKALQRRAKQNESSE